VRTARPLPAAPLPAQGHVLLLRGGGELLASAGPGLPYHPL